MASNSSYKLSCLTTYNIGLVDELHDSVPFKLGLISDQEIPHYEYLSDITACFEFRACTVSYV